MRAGPRRGPGGSPGDENVCTDFGGRHTICALWKLVDYTTGAFHCVSITADWLRGHLVSGGLQPLFYSPSSNLNPVAPGAPGFSHNPLLLEVDTLGEGGKIPSPPIEPPTPQTCWGSAAGLELVGLIPAHSSSKTTGGSAVPGAS